MSHLRYLFLVCSIAFFACTNDVAGTWEDENTLAQQSSSSVAESSAESSSSDIVISSSDIKPLLEVLWIDSTETEVYMGCVTYIKMEYIGELTAIPDTTKSNPAAIKGTFATNTSETEKKEKSTIVLSKFIEGRIKKLTASGIPESEADSIAQWELFKAIGIDTYIHANPNVSIKAINSTINYIFGGTTNSDSYKNVNAIFTETGTLQQEHYCSHFDQYAVSSHWFVDLSDDNIFLKGCSYSPRPILDNNVIKDVLYKCLNLPYCDNSIKDTVIKTNHNDIGDNAFVCKENGWERATDIEAETYGIPCDKEGKCIVHSKQPEYSYMCSLDSGWHAVYTIDAETFDEPCDKYGKLFKSPNRPNVTYACKDLNTIALSGKLGLYSCRTISIQDPYSPHASCRKVGWEIATQIDFETADVECDSEGKTHQSPSDSTLYYVCHQNKWTEFYNAPCDTDNKRIKTNKYSGFFICYNKTWRHSSSWRTDYPAEYYLNPDLEYGHFTDPRDNREYNTIEYKDKIWMAENMKYEGASENERKEMTFCNGNCENVGRYYNHEIAGEICPDGWRLPDSSDIIALGDSSTIHKLYTQFSGIGNEEPDSTLNPYGMSFLPIGKIEVKITSNSGTTSYKSSLSDKPCVPLWLNKTDGNGNRLYATIGFNDIDFQWYTPQQSPPNEKNNLFIPIRCIKK